MRLLLDTCIVIEAAEVNGYKRLPARVRELLQDEANELLFSAVSVTEMAVKTAIQKLNIPVDRVEQIVSDLGLTPIPFLVRHAMHLYRLPLHHKEPFDRMLIAVALAEAVPVVTSDREFVKYADAGLQVIST
jgi:PIN domain nuclease of toxin-antitoxin system